jgi:hypothetical protein
MFPAWNLSFIYWLLKVKWVLLIGQRVIIWLLAKTFEFLKRLLVFMFLLSSSNRLVNNYRNCFWMHLFCFQKFEVWHGLVIIMFVIDYRFKIWVCLLVFVVYTFIEISSSKFVAQYSSNVWYFKNGIVLLYNEWTQI